MPAHGLVYLDVSWVLTLPSIYMLSLGVETWSKSLLKVGFTRKARVLLGLQDQTPGFRRLDLDTRDPGVWPLDSAKLPFALSKNLVGFPLWPK